MKKVKSVPSHLNHMFSELNPIWSVLGSQEPYCNSNVFDPIVHHIGSWYLQTALWLQYQKRFDPNSEYELAIYSTYIASSYSELLFCSFSFFPADGVSHMLSTLYLFKHWQKLGFATLNRPIILCLSEACQCLLNTMLEFVNFPILL